MAIAPTANIGPAYWFAQLWNFWETGASPRNWRGPAKIPVILISLMSEGPNQAVFDKSSALPTNAATRFRQNLDSVASGTEDLLERLLEREPIASERLRPPRLLEAMRYASLGGGKRTLARHSALTARAND